MKLWLIVTICLVSLFSISVFGQELELDVQSLILKGDAYDYFGHPRKAFSFYDEALKLDPNNEHAQKGKDETYNQIKEIEENLEVNLNIAKDFSQDTIYMQGLGFVVSFDKEVWLNLVKADYHTALGESEQAIMFANKINPQDHNFDTWIWLIEIYSNNDQPKKVLELFDLFKTYPNDQVASWAGYLKVKALWKLGKYQEAVEFSNRFPIDGMFIDHGFREDASANNNLIKGILYQKVGDKENAQHYYNLALNTVYSSPVTGLPMNMVTEQDISEGIVKFLFDVGEYQQAVPYIENLQDDLKENFLKVVEYDKIINVKTIEQVVCGEGTVLKDGLCVPEKVNTSSPNTSGGGCLIATTAYGSELSPQVQLLREIRDNSLLQTQSGQTFMQGFNKFYYSFSPTIADWERQNLVFKEVIKLTITPLLASLSILNYVEMDSEEEVLFYGISLILLNIGMYFVAPTIVIIKIRKHRISFI